MTEINSREVGMNSLTMSQRVVSVGAIFIAATALWAADDSGIKVKEGYDFTAAMKTVAARFKGKPGVFLHLGDSITYANQNTSWARGGQGQSADEKAFLKWSHAGERNDSDGWYLASVDVPSGRSHTAASGVRSDEYLKGGKGGLPALAEIIKKYNPQLALYMLGTNDISANRPVAAYIADVEKAVDMLLANGTVVIVSTLPPYRGKAKQVEEYNTALRELAKKKQIPLVDLNAEMKERAGADMEKAYLSNDGVHLSFPQANGPATEENLKKSGYLLRCYLAVHKGMDVKAKVLDAK
jgi:lysophospholipase L1-like esterase